MRLSPGSLHSNCVCISPCALSEGLYLLPLGPGPDASFQFPSVRVMNHTCAHTHTRACANFCIYTLAQTPLYLRQLLASLGHRSSPSVALLLKVLSLLTPSILAPPLQTLEKQRETRCQSKQPPRIHTNTRTPCTFVLT